MVDFPPRDVDKEVHQLKLTTINKQIEVECCSCNLNNLNSMFMGILHLPPKLLTLQRKR